MQLRNRKMSNETFLPPSLEKNPNPNPNPPTHTKLDSGCKAFRFCVTFHIRVFKGLQAALTEVSDLSWSTHTHTKGEEGGGGGSYE